MLYEPQTWCTSWKRGRLEERAGTGRCLARSTSGRKSTSNVELSGLADSIFCPVIHLPLANPMKDRKQKVTLLHCYSTPPSFDYAVDPSALDDVNLHCNLVRTRLLKLCGEVQKFFAKCRCEFTLGSLPVEIVRASERLQADLIAVPLSLDFASHCWTTKGLLDELVRRANCAVFGVPSA
jgi:hypothetical protein